MTSTLEYDRAVARIAIALAHSLGERSLTHAEYLWRIHATEFVAGGQGFELIRSERWLATEQGVDAQQQVEQSIGNMHDQGVQILCLLDRLDDVYVVDAGIADHVVDVAIWLGFDATRDAAAE